MDHFRPASNQYWSVLNAYGQFNLSFGKHSRYACMAGLSGQIKYNKGVSTVIAGYSQRENLQDRRKLKDLPPGWTRRDYSVAQVSVCESEDKFWQSNNNKAS